MSCTERFFGSKLLSHKILKKRANNALNILIAPKLHIFIQILLEFEIFEAISKRVFTRTIIILGVFVFYSIPKSSVVRVTRDNNLSEVQGSLYFLKHAIYY